MGLDWWQDQIWCPLLGCFVASDSSTARLESCSFLCFRVMILAGVILALRLDSSGIKKGEFRTGHPQTLNKNAVARFMNSRCQVLHPEIYFLLWFLFKKGCACVMSSSWWGLTAQHYATEINSVYAGAPGMAQWGIKPGASPISGASTSSLCLSDISCVWTGTGFFCLFSQTEGKPWNPILLIFFPKPLKSIGRDTTVPLGTELCLSSDRASSSRQGKSCGCR